MTDVLDGIERCPHCAIARPAMNRVWAQDSIAPRGREQRGYGHNWSAFLCSSCHNIVLTKSVYGDVSQREVLGFYPFSVGVAEELPDIAKTFLKQSQETLHAPDGSAMLAGSAVDAMLKAKGYAGGSVYARIEQAAIDGVLTADMAEWAHSVRLGANRPRHSDEDRPHISNDEALQSLEFAKALGDFLFVFTERVRRGKEKAAAAESSEA